MAVWVHALVGQLQTPSGRDFLWITPQVLDFVKRTVRLGADLRSAAQPARTLGLLEDCMTDLPTVLRRERLVASSLILATLFADRATLVESDSRPPLDDQQFATHVTDVICAVIEAPSAVPPGDGSEPAAQRED